MSMTTAPVTVPVSAHERVHDSVPNEPMASAEAGCSNESLPVVRRSSRVIHKPSYLNRFVSLDLGEKRQTKVKIRFHHCGAFEGNPKSTYLDGKVQVVEHHDIEELCYWDLLSMVHQLKYGLNKVKCLYFLEPGKSLEDGLKLLFDDNSVLEFSNCLKSVGETIDKSSNKHGKEITMDETEDDLDMHDINLSSDEGNDELVGAREKVTKYVNDLVRLNIDDVDGSFPSQTRGTKDHSVESSRTHRMTDDGLDSDYIDSDDPGSYITTSDDSDADDARRVQSRRLSYNPSISNQGFFVGQIFRDSSQFRTALNDHSLEKRFSYKYKKNDASRVRAYCAANGCQWEILASIHGNDNSFRIKTYISEHSCLPTIHNKRVTSNVIASKLRDEISRMPYMKATDIRALVQQKLGVMVNISKVRRAKLQVIKSIQEKYIEEFKILREYCDELCETNPGQEDTDNWKWFLELLMNDLDIVDGIGLTIISDMQKNDYGPRILAKLEKSRVLASKWEVEWNGGIYHEVFYVNTIDNIRESYTVCLRNSTCTCRGWDINGVPCPHAFSAIIYEGGDPKDYLDDCYRRDNYLKAYKHMLHPVKGPMFWPKSNAELIVPPTRKKKHGRPQKERRREELDGPKKSKLSRVGRIMKCSICRLEGHNKTKCPMSKETQSSNPTNMKNVANKRKAHASTSDSQSSKRKEKKKEAQHHVSVLNVYV
ncbi:hypothetical protein V6N11_039368 [Hibiscus sabdariffa]|uniref:SWIM-type domain-containing protein n=1 Tax=Hibiscus sabdariffa TaxID=183260 RepID=A0ABR2SMS5_9ROSI